MQYVTKPLLEKLYHAWGVDAEIPSKTKKVFIAFPKTPAYQFSLVTVEKTELKSTEKRVLYKVEFSNP